MALILPPLCFLLLTVWGIYLEVNVWGKYVYINVWGYTYGQIPRNGLTSDFLGKKQVPSVTL